MTVKLLLIPTVNISSCERCLRLFHASLDRTSTTALVIYNGPDRSVVSDFSESNVIKVGYEDSDTLAKKFADIAECPKQLLFGEQEYGRSYGGASNLLIAVGCAIRASIMCKVDDDNLNSHSLDDSWLSNAIRCAKPDTVSFGNCLNSRSQHLLRKLPKNTASKLAEYIFSADERSERINCGANQKGNVVHNGNLVFMRKAPMSACYPVLYEPSTQIYVRGEIYYWMYELKQLGISFEYQKSLQLQHRPSDEMNLNDWLRSTVVGFDLSLVFRTYKEQSRKLTLAERRTAITQFQSWILKAEWPGEVAVKELVNLLEDTAFDFTEKFYSELPTRKRAWSRLVGSNHLSAVVREVLSGLEEKIRDNSSKQT